ncbi:hypothetical protein MD537_17105 [Flavihumibacter sediminis]|nr:hypothetical protein [Flavihumibacter sediminis]
MLFVQMAKAQDDTSAPARLSLHGYIKDLQILQFVDRVDSINSGNLFHNRQNFKYRFSKKISAVLEIRNRIFYGDQLKQLPDFGAYIDQYNGLIKLSKLWVNEKTLVVHSVIDRMALQYSNSNWDIKAGRQRINWGINNVWNPNDIFNAYNFLDFDYEERPGNDAIRVQHYFKNNTTLEAAYKPGNHTGEAIGAFLYKFNHKQYDYQFLAGIYQNDLVAGAGWAGSIGDAGFKGELSYFHPKKSIRDTTGTIAFSVMADQTFKNDWYMALSALFNNKPQNIPANGNIFSTVLSAKELFPYRYSFYLSGMKSFSLVSSLNLAMVYSPEKHSLILFPAYSRNITKNFDLDITLQSFFAKEGKKYRTQGSSFFLRAKLSY